MYSVNIPENDWQDVLEKFSERHSGAPIQFETHDRETDEEVTLPTTALDSIALDLEDVNNPRINVTVRSDNKEVKHILFRPSQVVLHISETKGDEALTIESLNTETTIRLQGAGLSGLVDRVA